MTSRVFAGWRWEEPHLLEGSEAVRGFGTGFLTPTPVLRGELVQLFGAVRDEIGRGTVTCLEVEFDGAHVRLRNHLSKVRLGRGSGGSFDENGLILGEVLPVDDGVEIRYVGFADAIGHKFAAKSGVARIRDDGVVSRRSSKPETIHPTSARPVIEAVHALRRRDDGWEALYSVGFGWERIGQNSFPRYDTFRAKGSDSENLHGSLEPLLPRPAGVYRLGRPRWMFPDSADSLILATGGRRSGDYRPYAFEIGEDGRYGLAREPFPFAPGMFAWSTVQLSYPAAVLLDDENALMFMNGDRMGAAGCFVSVGRR